MDGSNHPSVLSFQSRVRASITAAVARTVIAAILAVSGAVGIIAFYHAPLRIVSPDPVRGPNLAITPLWGFGVLAVVLALLVLPPSRTRTVVRAMFCTAIVVILLVLRFAFETDWTYGTIWSWNR